MPAFRVSRLASRALLGPLAMLALAAPAAAAPDPLLSEQWALSEAEAVGAHDAWTQSLGSGVVVAVLDTGVQVNHPDLGGSLWTNPDEVPGNGRDDDGNGFVDDVHGANMFDGGANIADDEGHGTHVAGIVAARAGNGVGGAGLAPAAKIMPVKVLNSQRAGNTAVLSEGIRYAVAEGARIINVSINGDGSSETLESAVRYAGQHGATVVASAGNNARDIDGQPSYPASLPLPEVLAVTATEIDGGLWGLANRGSGSVDIAAPGSQILSTARGSGYEDRSGTSMAAPFTSAALALLAAVRPDLPQAELRDALTATARRSSLVSNFVASGRLDVGAAMHRVLAGRTWRSAASAAPRLRLRVSARTRAGRRSTLRWSATRAARVTRWRVSLDGRVVATVRGKARRVVRRRISRPGRHRWRVVGLDATGRSVTRAQRSFRVLRRR